MKIHKRKGQTEKTENITPNQTYNQSNTDVWFNTYVGYLEHYINHNIKTSISYYQLIQPDTAKSNLYGETKASEKVFKKPVDVFVIIGNSNSELVNYANSGIPLEEIKEFSFNILERELNEKNIQINRGDYVGYNTSRGQLFFEVADANYLNTSIEQTIGIAPFFREIKCVPAKDTAFLSNNKNLF